MIDYGGNYDPSDRPAPLPEGEHELIISDAVEAYSKSDNLMLVLDLVPTDSQYSGTKIKHYIVLQNGETGHKHEWAERNIGKLLDAIGKNPAQSVSFNAEDLKGKALMAKIKHEEGNRGGKFPKVHYFIGQTETQNDSGGAQGF